MKKGWHAAEEDYLKENYIKKTIKELIAGLEGLSGRRRSADSINCKIKRMKADGIIEGCKEEDVVNRSLVQRRKNL
jgi:hypothetical protein